MKFALIPCGLVLLSPYKSRLRVLCRKKAHLFRNALRIVKKCIDCIVEVIVMSLRMHIWLVWSCRICQHLVQTFSHCIARARVSPGSPAKLMNALMSASGASLDAPMIIDPRLLYAYIMLLKRQVCDESSVIILRSLAARSFSGRAPGCAHCWFSPLRMAGRVVPWRKWEAPQKQEMCSPRR